MGTEHLGVKQSDTPKLTDEQIVEAAIDFAENLGYALQSWQATALRAILLYPGRIVVSPPRQQPPSQSFCTCTFDNHGFDSGCVVHDDDTI